MSWLLLQGLPPEPRSLTGEAKGAEIQFWGPFGVRGGVGFPGTGLCWKLDIPAPPPRGDTVGTSVFTRPGKMPLGPPPIPPIPPPLGGKGPPGPALECPEPGGPLGRSPGFIGPICPPLCELTGKFWLPMEDMGMLPGTMLPCRMPGGMPLKPGPGPPPMLWGWPMGYPLGPGKGPLLMYCPLFGPIGPIPCI